MEKVSLRTLIHNIQTTVNDIEHTKELLRVTRKPGKYQSYLVHLKYLKRRLNDFKVKLDKKLNGTISTVKFKYTNAEGKEILAEQTFVNLTQQEIRDTLELMAILENGKIEILEIKEIPTSVRIL